MVHYEDGEGDGTEAMLGDATKQKGARRIDFLDLYSHWDFSFEKRLRTVRHS